MHPSRWSLLWKLLAINLLVVGVAVVLAAVTIGQLADTIFMNLMQQFHIEVDVLHQLFVTAMTRSLVLASLAAGIVGLLLSLIFFQRVIQPVRGMMTMAERIAGGDYAARASNAPPDEIGRLAESLNHMAAALAELERLRQDLIANVAHELRTPLANLQGYLEAIRDGVAPASPETVATLHEETMRLVRLVDAVHELSRFDARLSRLRPVSVDVEALVRRLVDLRHSDFAAKGISVQADVDVAQPLQADPDLVSQAVHNLLDNAVKYTPAGGHVVVRAQAHGGHAQIAVTNSGDGIAPEDLTHIFERFYRGEKSRSRDLGGAGIGLSIVKEVARIHAGDVGAESHSGQTTIWLALPLIPPHS